MLIWSSTTAKHNRKEILSSLWSCWLPTSDLNVTNLTSPSWWSNLITHMVFFVCLLVLAELDGLSAGSSERENSTRVGSGAKSVLSWAKQQAISLFSINVPTQVSPGIHQWRILFQECLSEGSDDSGEPATFSILHSRSDWQSKVHGTRHTSNRWLIQALLQYLSSDLIVRVSISWTILSVGI